MSKIVHVNCKRCTTQQQLECLCAHLLHAAGPAQESVECATCGGTNAPRLRPTPHSSPVLHCHWPCSAQRLAKRSCVLKNITRKHLRLLACGVDHAICIISCVSGSVPVYPVVVASTGWLAGIAATRCVDLAVAVETCQIAAGHVYNWICEPVFQIMLVSTTGG